MARLALSGSASAHWAVGAQVQGGVVAEHLPVQALEPGSWLYSEFVPQHLIHVLVRGQRLSSPVVPVQREHELRPQALAQRVLAEQHGERGDCLPMLAEPEVKLDPVLLRR
jgi:hypothetical protein